FVHPVCSSLCPYTTLFRSGRVLTVPISQSGETADTLAALREARDLGSRAVAICNVVGSSLAREADGVVYTRAGMEIGVASTKALDRKSTRLNSSHGSSSYA